MTLVTQQTLPIQLRKKYVTTSLTNKVKIQNSTSNDDFLSCKDELFVSKFATYTASRTNLSKQKKNQGPKGV